MTKTLRILLEQNETSYRIIVITLDYYLYII